MVGRDRVRMKRNVDVVRIPCFQFGIFCDTDLSYFPGPNFDFAGPVHTNANLFLCTSAELTLYGKVSAVGEIVRLEMANGNPTDSPRDGPVYCSTTPGGCTGDNGSDDDEADCRHLQRSEGSVDGGPGDAENPNWVNISRSIYNLQGN